jgi:hypothetical protein
MPYAFEEFSSEIVYYSGKNGKVKIEVQINEKGEPYTSVFAVFNDGFGHEVPSVIEALLLLDVIS